MTALVQALPTIYLSLPPSVDFYGLAGREKEYLVPTLKRSLSLSLSSTKASFTLLTLYNYTTSTLLSFGVTGHLHHDLL